MNSGNGMMSAKNMGGVGSLLLVISGILAFGGIDTSGILIGLLVIVGIVLVLGALESMGTFYGDKKIFRDALYALIIGIVGTIVFIGTSIVASNSIAQAAAPQFITNFSAYNSQLINSMNLMFNLVIVEIFVFATITMIFFRSALGRLSTKTHVRLFGITGWFMIISAILAGILVSPFPIWVGCILLTVAFFSVKKVVPSTPQSSTANP